MLVALFAPPKFDLTPVRSFLETEGFNVRAQSLRADGFVETVPDDLGAGVLVFPDQGVVPIGDRTTILHSALGREIPLIVCCPQPTASDRHALEECGASRVVTPGTWEPRAVGERILGELILTGPVEPRVFGAMRGGTRAMRELYEAIDKVAPYSDPVLILGETGSGKELVAGEIHERSKQTADLIAIDCAALTPDLLQSELFGHEHGAFTGAVGSRTGLLAEAGEGTVFLDEIGDLALSSQAKLLRAIEERKVRPVGSNKWCKVDARLLFATNRDLEEACALKRFRQDLYARISGLTLHVPPLRTRRADLPWLAQGFLEDFNGERTAQWDFPAGALDWLFRYEWPSNVRELRQAIRKAAIFSQSSNGPISLRVLQETCRRRGTGQAAHTIGFDPRVDNWQTVLDRAQAAYFQKLMEVARGNKSAAAKLAGLSRSQLYEKLKAITSAPPASPLKSESDGQRPS